MSGTNPQALLSPWHRPKPLGFFGNGHDYLLSTLGTVFPSPDYMQKSVHNLSHHSSWTKNWRTNKGLFLSSFRNGKRDKKKKKMIGVLKCGSAFLAGWFHRPLPALRLWQDVFRRWEVGGGCVWGGKGRISFIMASEQHLGQMRVTEVPLAGGQSH